MCKILPNLITLRRTEIKRKRERRKKLRRTERNKERERDKKETERCDDP